MLRIEDAIVGNVEIEVAVVVGVAEDRGRGPERIAEPRLFRGIHELAAVVSQEYIGAKVGEIEVGIAVVVDIADGDAVHPRGARGAGALGRIAELPAPFVSIETAARPRHHVEPLAVVHVFHRAAIPNEKIHAAVAVEIEPRGAAAVALGDVPAPRVATYHLSVDPSFRRHVDEAEARLRRIGVFPAGARAERERGCSEQRR